MATKAKEASVVETSEDGTVTKVKCGKCGSALLAKLPSGELRCQHCGHQMAAAAESKPEPVFTRRTPGSMGARDDDAQ